MVNLRKDSFEQFTAKHLAEAPRKTRELKEAVQNEMHPVELNKGEGAPLKRS